MRRSFRLATVLRARRLQEDLARAAVAQAHAERSAARAGAQREEDALIAREVVSGGGGATVAAGLAARQSLAAQLSLAEQVWQDADLMARARLADWSGAAVRRRGLERLEERHDNAVRAADAAVEQRAADNLAATATHLREREA
ncbi:MAG: cell envelope biogenesis protein TolA [Pseudonocardiales bacterium]|nr:MAG: cell envelope biogenesis protein TolA [Pseudonocardiales bacterium]